MTNPDVVSVWLNLSEDDQYFPSTEESWVDPDTHSQILMPKELLGKFDEASESWHKAQLALTAWILEQTEEAGDNGDIWHEMATGQITPSVWAIRVAGCDHDDATERIKKWPGATGRHMGEWIRSDFRKPPAEHRLCYRCKTLIWREIGEEQ